MREVQKEKGAGPPGSIAGHANPSAFTSSTRNHPESREVTQIHVHLEMAGLLLCREQRGGSQAGSQVRGHQIVQGQRIVVV